jgi:hypothetical protein
MILKSETSQSLASLLRFVLLQLRVPTVGVEDSVSLAALRWIGTISYSLYLWQELFLPQLASEKAHGAFHYLQQPPWNVLAILVCACLSRYLLELPMIRFGHRLSATVPRPDSSPRPTHSTNLSNARRLVVAKIEPLLLTKAHSEKADELGEGVPHREPQLFMATSIIEYPASRQGALRVFAAKGSVPGSSVLSYSEMNAPNTETLRSTIVCSWCTVLLNTTRAVS